MKYEEAYKYGVLQLKNSNVGEAGLDARILLESVCGVSMGDLYAHPDRLLSDAEEKQYLHFIARRCTREPLQYITGEQWFMGLRFTVNRDVLIPRQDTETLVETVMKELHDDMSVLDVCTGSGCILLSLLKYSNYCNGVGVDLSEAALNVARTNAAELGIEADFVQSDLFDNVKGRFDVIVSNPPYIATDEIGELEPEVKDYEPFMALDGMKDGLFFYRKIISDAGTHLVPGGLLAFEIGCEQGEAVSGLLKAAGYIQIETVKDLCGLDRVVTGRKTVLEDLK